MTAFFSVVLALLIGFMFLTGSTVARVGAVIIAVLAVPALVRTLSNKAARDRDHLHPSR